MYEVVRIQEWGSIFEVATIQGYRVASLGGSLQYRPGVQTRTFPLETYLQQDIVDPHEFFRLGSFPTTTTRRPLPICSAPCATPTPGSHGVDEQEIAVDGVSQLCVDEVIHDGAKVTQLGLPFRGVFLLQQSLGGEKRQRQ